MAEKQEFLTYKGYPLVRSGKTIYYGNSYDAVGVKVYFSQYADRQMATDTAIGSMTEGNGYWLGK